MRRCTLVFMEVYPTYVDSYAVSGGYGVSLAASVHFSLSFSPERLDETENCGNHDLSQKCRGHIDREVMTGQSRYKRLSEACASAVVKQELKINPIGSEK